MSIFNKHRSKVQKFEDAIEGMSKEEVRDAEKHLLRPEDIPTYDGNKPKHRSSLASRMCLIVFKNKAQQDLIGEIFSIRESVNNEIYITDISLLEGIAKMVKEDVLAIVDGKIVEVPPEESSEHWHENEEGTIKVHLPDAPFEPLTTEQETALKKKKRKKYYKILDRQDVAAMDKFRAKHFPDKNNTEVAPKNLRRRRKL